VDDKEDGARLARTEAQLSAGTTTQSSAAHNAAIRSDHSPEQKSSASLDAELRHFYEE